MSQAAPGQTLSSFTAQLRFEDIPQGVLRRAENLMLDWFASALAGKGARPVEIIANFMERRRHSVFASAQVGSGRACLTIPDCESSRRRDWLRQQCP